MQKVQEVSTRAKEHKKKSKGKDPVLCNVPEE